MYGAQWREHHTCAVIDAFTDQDWQQRQQRSCMGMPGVFALSSEPRKRSECRPWCTHACKAGHSCAVRAGVGLGWVPRGGATPAAAAPGRARGLVLWFAVGAGCPESASAGRFQQPGAAREGACAADCCWRRGWGFVHMCGCVCGCVCILVAFWFLHVCALVSGAWWWLAIYDSGGGFAGWCELYGESSHSWTGL